MTNPRLVLASFTIAALSLLGVPPEAAAGPLPGAAPEAAAATAAGPAEAAAGLPQDTTDQEEAREEEEDDEEEGLPLEPRRTLELSVSEGTWISLDVSPDGRTIVFDLLGDLYTIPIEGGEATRITEGMAFDGQPRFSPDGERVVFVSDRSGAENLWIQSLDGEDTVRVTRGKDSNYHSPEWTPDGNYIVASRSHGLEPVKLRLFHVEDLNRQVAEVQLREGTPNDLLDQRDLALDEVARLVGADIRYADGDAQVLLDGELLVDGTDAASLTFDDVSGEIRADGADVAAGGLIGAQRRFLVETLPQVEAEFDAFASDLAGAVNDRHAQGYAPDGSPGGDLLDYDPAQGAASLQVAAGLTPADLAAAADPAAEPHDGRNGALLAALRDEAVGGATLDQSFAAIVVRLAGQVQAAGDTARAAEALSSAAEATRGAMHGVSLDEEMVSLVQHQRSLEATSRVMTAVDQALDTLINRTGVVGR